MVEIILNPGYEGDPLGISWYTYATAGNVAEFTIDEVNPISGTRSAKVVCIVYVAGACTWLQQVVGRLIVGQEYDLRVKYRSNVPVKLTFFTGAYPPSADAYLPAAPEGAVSETLHIGPIPAGLTSAVVSVELERVGELTVDDWEMTPTLPAETYDLTITAVTGGTTDPTPGTYTFDAGTPVKVTAYPDIGQYFQQWTLNGAVRRENPITIIMDADYTLIPSFAETPPPALPPELDLPVIAAGGIAVVDAVLVGYYLLKRFKII